MESSHFLGLEIAVKFASLRFEICIIVAVRSVITVQSGVL